MSFKIETPLQKLYQWEKERPNEVYLHQPIQGKYTTYTWKAFGQQVRKMAAFLKGLDIPQGSKIALISKNCAHWLMSDLAIMMSGHVSVPLYPNISPDTVSYILEHSEAKVLLIGKLDDWESMKAGVIHGVRQISFPTSMYGPAGYEDWDDVIQDVEPMGGEFIPNLEDLCTIIYTSGTTGKPKGVMQSFKALSFASSGGFASGSIEADTNSRFFSYLPLSHIAERLLVAMGGTYSGSQVYFAESLATFAENLRYAQPTIFLGVPRIWTKFQMGVLAKMPQKRLDFLLKIPIIKNLIKGKIQKTLGLDKVHHAFTGAAPTPTALMDWYEKLGINIQEAYGMTENCAYSHLTRRNTRRSGSTGQAQHMVDHKISDIGEILVKSEANMTGYYKMPELTKQSFQDGYLRTGDEGKIDHDGYLFITGRVKDIFKTAKAKYVAPTPIEMKLSDNTNIEQICLVGKELPQPIALVVLSEDAQQKDRAEVAASLMETVKATNPSLQKHEKVKKMIVMKEAWTVENALLTPTMKIKRNPIEKIHQANYLSWYAQDEEVIWL